MDQRYRVDVQNRFVIDLGDDSEDPDDILRLSEEKSGTNVQPKEKKHSKKVSPFNMPTSTEDKAHRSHITRGNGRRPPPPPDPPGLTYPNCTTGSAGLARPSTGGARRVMPVRSVAQSRMREIDTGTEQSFQDNETEIFRGHGGSRLSRGGPRLSRGGSRLGRGRTANISDHREKREMDRLSGMTKSTVKPTDKREGRGAYNWGTATTEIESPENEEGNSDDSLTGETKNKEAEKSKTDDVTFEEWKRREEAKRHIPSYNLRKPDEDDDMDKWGKTYILKKKESDEEEENEDGSVKPRRQKNVADLESLFSDMSFGHPVSRGHTRKTRQSRGSSAGVSSGQQQPAPTPKKDTQAPQMDNLDEFPSL